RVRYESLMKRRAELETAVRDRLKKLLDKYRHLPLLKPAEAVETSLVNPATPVGPPETENGATTETPPESAGTTEAESAPEAEPAPEAESATATEPAAAVTAGESEAGTEAAAAVTEA
ncbi:MAG: hypothetical protein ACKPJD_01815, partial [Planctomycetaceae bacterium]